MKLFCIIFIEGGGALFFNGDELYLFSKSVAVNVDSENAA